MNDERESSDLQSSHQQDQKHSSPSNVSESYRIIAEAIPQMVWTAGPDGTTDYFNQRWVEYTGLSVDELMGWKWQQVMHPEDLERTLETWRKAWQEEETYEIEYRIRRHDGEYRWYLGRACPVKDTTGIISRWLGTCTDIHDQKEAEQSLRESERYFQMLADTAPVMVWMADPDMHCSFFNQQWLQFTGRALQQELGNGWSENVHPEDLERCLNTFSTAFHQQTPFRMEYRLRRADGDYRWLLDHGTPRYSHDGSFAGYIGSCMDITERYLHETTLREEAETLEILNKIGQLLSAELDLQKLVQGVTDAATSLTGAQYGSFFYNRTDDTGQSYLLYTLSGVPREHFAHFPMPRATDLFGPTFRGEGTLRLEDVRKDRRYGQSSPYYGLPPGHLPVVSYLATPVISRSGEVLGGLFFGHSEPSRFTERHERIVLGLAAQTAIAMDNARLFSATQQEIAERRRTEVELQRAKEVAETANNAKNQFLAVLSHELRTPLNPTLTAVQAIEEDPVLAEELRPLVEIIHRNVELEARLIDDLLDVTRIERGKLELEQEQVNSHDLLRHVIRTCEGELNKKQLRTSVELTAQQHTLYADPARLQQIYWNLISNAIKFTPQGGTVTVRTFNDAEQRLITEITDTGIGISDEDTARIFDAFEQGERTITRQYGGLGLGLSISKSLIELHGGTLTASSAGKNMGATFSVTMPTVAQNTSATDRIMPSEQEQSPSATILVVEDHTDTRKVMKLLLERRGYNVETASTIADALNTARSLSYDFLISDIGLPDGSGIELLKQLEEIRTVPAIALSGFGMEEDRKRSLAAGFAAHLVKPVDFQLLDTTIRQLLSAKR